METETTTSPKRAARIVLALSLAAGSVVGLTALLRPAGTHPVPITALGAPEPPPEGEVVADEPVTTTAADETTTVPTEAPTTEPTDVPVTTVPVPVTTTEAPSTTVAPTDTTEVTAPPETTTTVPEPTTTTVPEPEALTNPFIAYYPDGMPAPTTQMPGMDNPSMGTCHLVGTNANGETVAEPCP